MDPVFTFLCKLTSFSCSSLYPLYSDFGIL
jgi:hypothetical protein